MQRNSQGKGKGVHSRFDACLRPSLDGSGTLEQIFLPMLTEFVTRHRPSGVWIDGDHARTATCYCPTCCAAWQAATGQEQPPKSAAEPGWPDWLKFEQQRFDEYRRRMAKAIHAAHNDCLYTSNHSWRFRSKDPRDVPDFVDTISGDLSHGPALRMTRLSAMQISPETRVPTDIMHNIMNVSSNGRQQVSLRRIEQMGGLTFAGGGAWFLWTPGSNIVQPEVQKRAKHCADFAQARKEVLGRTTSLNPVAVLLSETSWQQQKIAGVEGSYDQDNSENLALALQDVGYAVDLTNEEILREQLGHYQVVFIANQHVVAEATLTALKRFVHEGGMLVVLGSGLTDMPGINDLLGVSRVAGKYPLRQLRTTDEDLLAVSAEYVCQPKSANILAEFDDGLPALTVNSTGRGRAAYVACPTVAYPDEAAFAIWLMRNLGFGPEMALGEGTKEMHLLVSLRRKQDKAIIHLTDLASRRGGHRIETTQHNMIDNDPPQDGVIVRLAWPAAPEAVTAHPGGTQLKHTWSEGVLELVLNGFCVHAAVVVKGDISEPFAFLDQSEAFPRPTVVRQLPTKISRHSSHAHSCQDFRAKCTPKVIHRSAWTLARPRAAVNPSDSRIRPRRRNHSSLT
ncbi:MAG: beta-galactosidase trimerization domain-containing protein [Planctomycetes bacterium]|nr:beta-galactosidase trimerization domain-containing protein [Planctomycetota bacterium]